MPNSIIKTIAMARLSFFKNRIPKIRKIAPRATDIAIEIMTFLSENGILLITGMSAAPMKVKIAIMIANEPQFMRSCFFLATGSRLFLYILEIYAIGNEKTRLFVKLAIYVPNTHVQKLVVYGRNRKARACGAVGPTCSFGDGPWGPSIGGAKEFVDGSGGFLIYKGINRRKYGK